MNEDPVLFIMTPSYFSQIINGILIFIALFLICKHHKHFMDMEYTKQVPLILTAAIAFGVHGTLHLGLEQFYNYNPLLAFF